MLSRHPERCRFPHGHTRAIEVVVTGESLDENGMLIDFKALKMAIVDHVDRYDHALAVNSTDPFLPALQEMYPDEALVIYEDIEPTTEAMAKELFDYVAGVLAEGFVREPYRILPGKVSLERVRVWETPDSWAEYGR